MDQEPLLIEEIGAILQITLNRPEKLNALTAGMISQIRAAVADYAVRPDLRCCVFRARGRYFSAGADLTVVPDDLPDGNDTAAVRQWYRTVMGGGMQPLYAEMEVIEKPFVSAAHANCVGGGLELSLSCDFRLAARSAGYSFPEAKLGTIPASNGVSRLTRLVGPHWAKYAIMANKRIDAERALAIGLVHEVYDDDAFEDGVSEFCRDLADKPPQMMAIAKLAIDLSADSTSANAKKIERLGQSILHGGDEAQRMIAAVQARLMKQA